MCDGTIIWRRRAFGALMAIATVLLVSCASLPVEGARRDVPGTPLVQRDPYSARAFYETTSYSLPSQSGFGFSSDGASLLVSSDQTGVYNAYTMALNRGVQQSLTASNDDATTAISFFPADDRALVRADDGGNELYHLYVRERDGSLRDLTPGPKVKAAFVGWKGSGDVFWLTTNERDDRNFDVYAYDAASYSRKLVFQNTGYDVSGISRDGRWLALRLRRTSADADLFLVDLASGSSAEPRLITSHSGNVAHDFYTFAPDGRSLVYRTDEHGEFAQAWSYDLMSGQRRPLIAANWDVTLVDYSPSGRYRVSAVNADAATELTVLDQETRRRLKFAGLPEGDITLVRFDRGERRIALIVASDTSPGDIFIADLVTGATQRLTNAINPEINEGALVRAQVVRYRSFDGLEIPALLYRAPRANPARPAPALVWVHGGPGGQSYSATIQHLVNNGYTILAGNNRGSGGYGKTFHHMDDRRHGEGDLQDIVHARKYLESLNWVDHERIGIFGQSYGGYMVAAALTFEPEAFDVGMDMFGVTNWLRTLSSIPSWWGTYKAALLDEMGDPVTDAERLRRISPLFHAQRIVRPLLVVQGANDPRVLQAESDELVAAVRRNGVPVEYLVFPDEGHGFLHRKNLVAASEAYLRFLKVHLPNASLNEGPLGTPSHP